MTKVKYPVKAALARFLPIYNHLTNMVDFLLQAGLSEKARQVLVFKRDLKIFEKEIQVLRRKESVKCPD